MNGLGSTYLRGAVYWIAYYHGGKLFRESARSPSEAEARKLLKRRQRQMGKGTPTPNLEQVTLATLLEDLETNYAVNDLPSRRNMKAHRTALLDAFGPGARAIDITKASVATATKGWQREGYANATINRFTSTLCRAFALAEFPSIPNVENLKEDNAREGFYSKTEFYAILGHVQNPVLRDFIEWGYWTGMRKGEISKLTRALVDRETWTITLPGRVTKNGKPRTLALRGPFKAIIERRLAAARPDCPLLFYRFREGKPVRIYEFRKAWARACRKAGLGVKLFHDLRRTGVRNLVRAGVTRKTAMAISGHRTEAVFERYNITDDADLEEAADKLVAYVGGLPSEPAVVVPIGAASC